MLTEQPGPTLRHALPPSLSHAAGRVRELLDLLGRSVTVALRCEALLPAA